MIAEIKRWKCSFVRFCSAKAASVSSVFGVEELQIYGKMFTNQIHLVFSTAFVGMLLPITMIQTEIHEPDLKFQILASEHFWHKHSTQRTIDFFKICI